jgi:D-aminoacyl-tRNA deacylase
MGWGPRSLEAGAHGAGVRMSRTTAQQSRGALADWHSWSGLEQYTMKTVVQRVHEAWVEVEGRRRATVGRGLLALVGIEQGDAGDEIAWMAEKLANLRIFEDAAGRMNLSVLDIRGDVLLVPNFTVAGDARKGRRPSFDGAMRPESAEPLFAELARELGAAGVPVQTGIFRVHMHVGLVNDGPVTIVLSRRKEE